MAEELARTGVAGFAPRDETAILVALLSLTTDAVLVFDEDGIVVLANEEAERTFRSPSQNLVDTNVRILFPPADTVAHMQGPLEESLPFPLDGTSSTVTCEGSQHGRAHMRVRCERIAAARAAYLLCAHVLTDGGSVQDENDRLVEELSRANRRLSGTLGIVLGTLDSLDVGTLFSRILDEITRTMDAWASLVYMAEQEGYRLSGMTDTVRKSPVPLFLPYISPLAEMAAQQGKSLCLRVRPLSRDELRLGEAMSRTVVDEESGTSVVVPVELLPPFSSFVVVPVWFGGHMIALICVGWRHAHRLRKDDARLLDSVAEYLSVQLAGAFAALRAQHAERLESLGSLLREQLMARASIDAPLLGDIYTQAAEGIEATCVPLEGNPFQRTTMGDFPHLDRHALPLDLPGIARAHETPCVLPTAELGGLEEWLLAHGEPSRGVLMVLGSLDDVERGCLMLRESESEPLQDADVSFLDRLAEDIMEVAAGEEARKRDKRISQALQLGMRNELQRVEGLSAQSRYSSATEAAYVGGDFYDLVRLPNRRACVIMGDVSGKGVEAASVSSGVKTALGAYAWEGLRPARMVTLLNDFLLGFSRIETFATLFVGFYDLEAGTLTYCSAGHPPALMVRAGSGELMSLDVQSGVVGAFDSMRYKDGEVSVGPGDILVLYTDGVTEARSPSGAFFGEDGLRDAVAQEAARGFEGMCDRVLEDVSAFAGNSLEDDVALVIVRVDEV